MKRLIPILALVFALAPVVYAGSATGVGTNTLDFDDYNPQMTWYKDGSFGDVNCWSDGGDGSCDWHGFIADGWFGAGELHMYEGVYPATLPTHACESSTEQECIDNYHAQLVGCWVSDGSTWETCSDTPPPVGATSDVPPSGAVWAMSALSIFTLIQFVYFLIFFMILYVISWGILQVLKPIFRIITYGD